MMAWRWPWMSVRRHEREMEALAARLAVEHLAEIARIRETAEEEALATLLGDPRDGFAFPNEERF